MEKLQAVATCSNPRWFNAKNAKVITKGKNNIFLNQSHRSSLWGWGWGGCIFLISDSTLAHSPAAIHHGREETLFDLSTQKPPRADILCPRQLLGSLPRDLSLPWVVPSGARMRSAHDILRGEDGKTPQSRKTLLPEP